MVSLLAYIVPQVVASKSPGLLDFHQDLISLEAATKVKMRSFIMMIRRMREKMFGFLSWDLVLLQIQLKSLAEEMQAIIKGLEKVKQELVASENDGPVSEVFRKVSKYVS